MNVNIVLEAKLFRSNVDELLEFFALDAISTARDPGGGT